MHFPRYWAKGTWQGPDHSGAPTSREAWGWSDTSEAEARKYAEARARQAGEQQPSTNCRRCVRGNYPYPKTPLREPVLRLIPNSDRTVHAVVTRNAYGCEVLNTDRVAFIDVDLPPQQRPGILARLFGAQRHDERRLMEEAARIALLEVWQNRHPEFAFRVYRTAAGLRYLVSSMLVVADHPLIQDAFEHLKADAAYRQLCRSQKSYRARLTPKPWRCAVARPPHRFPFATATQSDRAAAWVRDYEAKAKDFAVCLHLMNIGSAPVCGSAVPIIAEHDRVTRAMVGMPLA